MINPMTFVTPVRQGRATSGLELGRFLADQRSEKARQGISEGYLALQTRQQDLSEQKLRQAELDKAIADLDDARLLGNPDHVTVAEDNLRRVAGRHGYSLSEATAAGGAPPNLRDFTSEGAPEQEAEPDAELPTEAPAPADTTAEQESFFRGLGKGKRPAVRQSPQVDPDEAASNARIDAALQRELLGARAFGASLPPQRGSAPGERAATPGLRGGMPPMRSLASLAVVDKDGKELYRASGGTDEIAERQRQRARGVFSELAKQAGDDVEATLIQQAGDVASGLVGVVPLEKAVGEGLELYQRGMMSRNKLAVVLANKKRQNGGTAAPGSEGLATGRTGSALSALSDDMDATVRLFSSNEKLAALNESDRLLDTAESSLESDNVASQWDAINQIVAARSGKTVSDRERTLYRRLAGLSEELKNQWNQIAGTPMADEYKRQLRQTVAEIRAVNQEQRRRVGAEAYEYHKSKIRGRVPADQAEADSRAVQRAISGESVAPQSAPARRGGPAKGSGGGDKNKKVDAILDKLEKRLGGK